VAQIIWDEKEEQVLLVVGPQLNHKITANLLNHIFFNNRTAASVKDKSRRMRFGRQQGGHTLDDVRNNVKKSTLPENIKKNVLKFLDKQDKTPPGATPQKPVQMEVAGNYATMEQTFDQKPQTLEELLSLMEVDLDVWGVDHYVINKWEQASKTDRDITVTPLYQIKVWLVRKAPIICAWPSIQQVTFEQDALPQKKVHIYRHRTKIKKALVVPDSQVTYRRNPVTGHLDPTHDRLVWDVVCQIAESEKPDTIIFLGDMLDLPDWSDKFITTPDLYFTTQPALLELHWWLRRLMKTHPEKCVYLEGNHEARLHKAVARNIIAAYDIRPANAPLAPAAMSIENLLGLKSLGIEYLGPYPTSEYWINDNLRAVHGEMARQESGATVAATVKNLRCSEIFGHIHRIEQASKLTWNREGPKQYTAVSPGTLARLDPGIVPSGKGRQNWQNGFAMVDYEEGDGFFDIHIIPVIHGKSMFGGKLWQGVDHTNAIAKDTGWEALKNG